MSAASNSYSMVTQDLAGNSAKTKVPVSPSIFSPSDTTLQSIKTAYSNCSNAAVIRTELSTQAGQPAGQTPPTSQTPTVQDRLVMTMRGVDNSTLNYKIPGPTSGIYIAGSDTVVDLTATAVTNYADDMNLYGCTEAAQEIGLVSGLRIGTKQVKR